MSGGRLDALLASAAAPRATPTTPAAPARSRLDELLDEPVATVTAGPVTPVRGRTGKPLIPASEVARLAAVGGRADLALPNRLRIQAAFELQRQVPQAAPDVAADVTRQVRRNVAPTPREVQANVALSQAAGMVSSRAAEAGVRGALDRAATLGTRPLTESEQRNAQLLGMGLGMAGAAVGPALAPLGVGRTVAQAARTARAGGGTLGQAALAGGRQLAENATRTAASAALGSAAGGAIGGAAFGSRNHDAGTIAAAGQEALDQGLAGAVGGAVLGSGVELLRGGASEVARAGLARKLAGATPEVRDGVLARMDAAPAPAVADGMGQAMDPQVRGMGATIARGATRMAEGNRPAPAPSRLDALLADETPVAVEAPRAAEEPPSAVGIPKGEDSAGEIPAVRPPDVPRDAPPEGVSAPAAGRGLFSTEELAAFDRAGIDVSGVSAAYAAEARQQLAFRQRKDAELNAADYDTRVREEYARIEGARRDDDATPAEAPPARIGRFATIEEAQRAYDAAHARIEAAYATWYRGTGQMGKPPVLTIPDAYQARTEAAAALRGFGAQTNPFKQVAEFPTPDGGRWAVEENPHGDTFRSVFVDAKGGVHPHRMGTLEQATAHAQEAAKRAQPEMPAEAPPAFRFDAARDDRNRLRANLKPVSDDGLLREYAALQNAEVAAQDKVATTPQQWVRVQDDGSVPVSGGRLDAGMARQQLRQISGALARVGAELERRGIAGDDLDDRLYALLEREGMDGVVFTGATGHMGTPFGSPEPLASPVPGAAPRATPPTPPAGTAPATSAAPMPAVAQPPAVAAPRASAAERVLARRDVAEVSGTVGGAAVGAATADEDRRGMGAVYGALGGFALTRGGGAGAVHALRARELAEAAKPLITINRTLADAVGVSLRQGRGNMGRMQVRGWYQPLNDAIRVRRYGMVDTGAHEVGHYLSNRYFGTAPGARKRGQGVPIPAAVRQELLDAGKALYGSRKPTSGYAEEGVAEWAKFYVTKPAQLDAMPNARDFLGGLLEREPALKAAMDQARDDYARFMASPASQKVAAMLSVDEGAWARPGWLDVRRAWEDDLVDVKRAVAALQAERAVPARQNAYTLARLTRGVAGEAEQALARGITLADGTSAGGPLSVEQAIRSIPRERVGAFREYLVAERALEKAAQGVDTGVNPSWAQDVVRLHRQDPTFAAAAEALWAHSNALLALRVEAGLLTPQQAQAILAKNQKRVPFYRVFDEAERARGLGSSGRAPAKNSAGVHRMKGSDRRIVDPLESILKDTHDTYRQVRQHQAIRALVLHAHATPNGARFVEVLRERPMERLEFDGGTAVGQVLQRLEDAGLIDPKVTGQKIEALGDDDLATLMGALVDYRERTMAGSAERRDLVIPMLLDGRRQWVQVKDAKLYEALLGMNREELAQWQRVVSAPTRLLRAGATLTAEFIARNPIRDAWSAAVRTRATSGVLPGVVLPFEHLARGVFHLVADRAKQGGDAMFDAWRRRGGDNAALLSLDRTKTQRTLRDLQATALERGWHLATHPIDALRLLSSISENATRLGEFDLVYRQGTRRGLSHDDAATEAAMAARDVSTDFAKAGVAGRAANQLIEFLNAGIQGGVNIATDLNVRRDPKRAAQVVARAAAMVTLPSVALWLAQHEDPVYQDVPREVRDRNWVYVHRPVQADGTLGPAETWLMPKPFEYGVLFGSVPEHLLDWVAGEDPEALAGARDALIAQFVPNYLPTFARPAIEVFANRDFYQRRPIVPRGLEGVLPEDRARETTGETARLIGQGIGQSPAQVEHVLTGYTAGLGRTALGFADGAVEDARAALGLDPLRRSKPLEQTGKYATPGLRAFVRPAPGANAESVERVYRDLERAEQTYRSFEKARASGDISRAVELMRKHPGLIAGMQPGRDGGAPGSLRALRAQLDATAEERARMLRAPLPADTRRRQVRASDDQRLALARMGRRAVQLLSKPSTPSTAPAEGRRAVAAATSRP